MASALVRAQNAAQLARAKVRQYEGPLGGAKDALIVNSGALAAGFVDRGAELKLPDMKLRPSLCRDRYCGDRCRDGFRRACAVWRRHVCPDRGRVWPDGR